jgi:hypothetical protein
MNSLTPWIGLIGVALGFALGEGSRYARYRLEIQRNKSVVHQELETICAQIPQKKDILNQAIAHLKTERFMRTLSVRMVTTGYYAVISDLYPHISHLERNVLHVIYERLRVADEQLDGLEEAFVRTVKDKVVNNPLVAFSDRLQELLESYTVVDDLARSYLNKRPVDVFSVAK